MSNDSVITNRLEPRKCQTLPPRMSSSIVMPRRPEHWSGRKGGQAGNRTMASDDISEDLDVESSLKATGPEKSKARTMDDALPFGIASGDHSSQPTFPRTGYHRAPTRVSPFTTSSPGSERRISTNTGNIYTVTTDSFNDNSTTVQVMKQTTGTICLFSSYDFGKCIYTYSRWTAKKKNLGCYYGRSFFGRV